jgi:hypothetical protein
MTGLLVFIKSLRGYTPAVYARFRMAGHSLLKIGLVRFTGIFAIHAVIFIILCAFAAIGAGWLDGNLWAAIGRGIALAACFGAFGMFAASLFRNETACGLFIFLTALGMYGFSGGSVPLAFIPRGLHALRFASFPYWTVDGGGMGTVVLAVFAVVLFGVACLVEFFYLRFPRAV